jgi:hypothetical protein
VSHVSTVNFVNAATDDLDVAHDSTHHVTDRRVGLAHGPFDHAAERVRPMSARMRVGGLQEPALEDAALSGERAATKSSAVPVTALRRPRLARGRWPRR